MYPDINKKEKSKQEMKADIILSGVGGQGILSIAAVIGEAALKEGLYMKQAESSWNEPAWGGCAVKPPPVRPADCV